MSDLDLFSDPEPEAPRVCGTCASFTMSVLGARHFCAESLMDVRACDTACANYRRKDVH